MAMSLKQKEQVEKFLGEKVGSPPCALCNCSGHLIVQDDPVGPPVWQPKTETNTMGIDPLRTFPFIVACCGNCHAAHLFPWGLIFGFSEPAPEGAN
jgi:hypothetical protein